MRSRDPESLAKDDRTKLPYKVSAFSSSTSDLLLLRLMQFLYRWILPLINFRGATYVGRNMNRIGIVIERRLARVRLDYVEFLFPILDPYWGYYFYVGREYEPEVAAALRILNTPDRSLFVDCGANYGFWSQRVAAGEFGDYAVVALEPSPRTFALLSQNLDRRGEAICAAVWSSEGHVFFDESGLHAARGVTESGDLAVPATTIDAIVARAEGTESVVVKLDVEGGERAALEGARRTLATANVALLYEDHGSDSECSASVAMLNSGLNVYFVTAAGSVRGVSTVEEVRRVKLNAWFGYNFVAARPGSLFDATMGRVFSPVGPGD